MIDAQALRLAILQEAARRLNARLPQAVGPVRARIAQAVRAAVEASPEYASLRGGKLQAELGVVDPQGAVEHVVAGIANAMQVELRPVVATGTAIVGGMTVRLLRTDLSDVFDAPGASFKSEGGYQIDWLDWLLTAGDSFIVVDYEFVPGPHPGSRTGLGVMRKAAVGWRVPPEFAGKPDDNWLTRALGSLDDDMAIILAQELGRVMS